MISENPTDSYHNFLKEQQREIQEMILAGINQIDEGKTKDLDEVCDRLEKKYRDLGVDN